MRFVLAASLLATPSIALAQVGIPDLGFEDLTHEETEKRVRECGIQQIEIVEDELLQMDIVEISDIEITAGQLDCLAQALDLTFFQVDLPEAHRPAYSKLSRELSAPRNQAFALSELARFGIEPLAPFDSKSTSEREYANLIEERCGPAAAGAFGSEYGPTTISPEWITQRDGFRDEARRDAITCLFLLSSVGNFPIGFIGNELAPDVSPSENSPSAP